MNANDVRYAMAEIVGPERLSIEIRESGSRIAWLQMHYDKDPILTVAERESGQWWICFREPVDKATPLSGPYTDTRTLVTGLRSIILLGLSRLRPGELGGTYVPYLGLASLHQGSYK